MKKIIFLAFVTLLELALALPASAGNILNVVDASANPSCAFLDVQAAINAAQNGDTVVLAAGTCVWTAKLNFTKAITLQGAGCALDADGRAVEPCQTVIKDNSATGGNPLINWTCVTGLGLRLTGIEFQNGGRQGYSGQAAIFITCPVQKSTSVRIDHNVFDHVINSTGNDPSDGKPLGINTAVGVIDHNTFLAVKDTLLFYGLNWDGIGGFGDESWHAPVSWGSPDFMFVEDNTFVMDASASCTDAYGGARFVVRFNKFVRCTTNNHGTDSTGRTRASRALESYANNFEETGTSRSAFHAENRDGALLLWGNSGNLPLGFNPFAAALRSYRSYTYFAPFGQQDGTSPWDLNDPNNPYDPGALCPGRICTVTSAGSLNVSVSGAAWTQGQWTDYLILKVNCTPSNGNGCAAPIAGNSATQINFLSANGEGANLSFSAGDTFKINRVLAGMDQPGRGQGGLVSGLAVAPIRPAGWNDQVDFPSMEWLNINNLNGANLQFAVGPDCPGCVKNVNYLDYESGKAFDGSIAGNRSSIGVGSLGGQSISQRFPTCTVGVAYWATDQGSWNAGTNSLYAGQGVLYKCLGSNTWIPYYTPYPYPHPLTAGGGGSVVGNIVGGGVPGGTATQTSISVNQATVPFGATQTFTAKVVLASDGITPVTTGTVSFSTGVTFPLNASGQAQMIVVLGVGSNQSIQATYNGDGAHTQSVNSISVTVSKATLTVTPNPRSKAYGQNFTAFTAVITGLQGTDAGTATFASPGAGVAVDVGTYDIIASGFNFTSGKASNYSLTLNTTANGLTVTKEPLTITATGGKNKPYGQTFSAYTAAVIGLQNGDIGTVTYTSLGEAAAAVPGVYDIVVTAFNFTSGKAGNYNITLTNAVGGLTVLQAGAKATLTVTADSKTITYPAAVPTLTYTYSGFVNGDTAAAINGTPGLSVSPTLGNNGVPNAGSWTITPDVSTLTATNYIFSAVSGTLAVNKAPLSVTADDKSIASGASPTYTATISGLVNGDSPAVVTGTPAFTTNATITNGFPSSGSWSISPTLGTLSAANYTFVFVDGNLTVSGTATQVISFVAPTNHATVGGTVPVVATVTSATQAAVSGFQLLVDGNINLGAPVVTPVANGNQYSVSWDTTTATNGSHTITATFQDATNQSTSRTITVNVSNAVPTKNLTVPGAGGISFLTNDPPTANRVDVFHALVQQGVNGVQTGSNALAGVAIIGLRQNGALVTEAGVPASSQILVGRIYAENHGIIDTGIALSNDTNIDAAVSFYFTDSAGQSTNAGSLILPAGHQISNFLNQPPFNGPPDIVGSFTFTSTVPLGAIALRGHTNERSDFLLTTMPVATLDTISSPAVLPHFADGAGWKTQVILTNNSDAVQTGTVQFFSQGSATQSGQVLTMTINGVSSSSFNYTIPAHAVTAFPTPGTGNQLQVGWVEVSSSGPVPSAVSVFSFKNSQGITVTEASAVALPMGTDFQGYFEASGVPGQPGSIQSGVALANPSSSPVLVNFQLANLDGTPLNMTQSVSVPAGGQIAQFVNQLFPQISASFQGVARITSSTPVSIAVLRDRYNERDDFLITTTPPLNNGAPPSGNLVLPHIVSGMGYSTQIILFGQGGSSTLYLLDQNGNLKPSTTLIQQ